MSTLELRNVVISGRGFEVRIAKIEPRETTSVLIRLRGESGIAIAFDAGGRHYAYPEQDYVEASSQYRVRIIVRHDLSAEVSTMLLRD